MDNFFETNGKYYAVDIDKVIEFINCDNGSVVQGINQTYGLTDENDMQLLQKEVTETKDSVNSALSSYRYNIVTNMMSLVLSPIEFNEGIVGITDMSGFSVGQKIAFNTLLGMGIIYEIDVE